MDELVIWYPSGDWQPLLSQICKARNRGYLTVVTDRDGDGKWFYEIGPGPGLSKSSGVGR
jgi:hypothetical protein